MCKYKTGEVVWALVPFSDGTGQKARPCIILELDRDCRYFLMECCSLLDKHHKMQGIIIRENHEEFFNMGLKNSSFINFSNKVRLPEKFLIPPPNEKNPMGICNLMDEIKK